MNRNERALVRHKGPLRNLALVLAMFLVTFALLIFLGVVHLSQPDFEGIRQAVAENHDPEVMTEADELTLRKHYGLNARDLEHFVYYAPKSSMDASEILVIQARTPEEASALEGRVTARRSTNQATFRNYRPEQAEILERSHLKIQGDYLIFISAENVAEIREAVDRAFR